MSASAEERVQERLSAGDHRGAASEAIRGFGPKVLGYLRSILRDDEDAADAFSHFAEDLWRGIPGFRGESSFKTWAYKLAWCAAMHVRSDAFRRLGRRLETGEASRLAAEVRTKSVVRDETQRLSLERLREALSAEEQTLLFLRLDQQLDWNEVAEVLSAGGTAVEPTALRKRYERLKERLARLAREQGLTDR
jgi:RNA polymerase sigma-70 factor (ECF subfamily)